MVQEISIQAYLAKKMSALRVLEQKGADEALRLYPEFNLLLLGLKGLGGEQLHLLRQSVTEEMQKFTDA